MRDFQKLIFEAFWPTKGKNSSILRNFLRTCARIFLKVFPLFFSRTFSDFFAKTTLISGFEHLLWEEGLVVVKSVKSENYIIPVPPPSQRVEHNPNFVPSWILTTVLTSNILVSWNPLQKAIQLIL